MGSDEDGETSDGNEKSRVFWSSLSKKTQLTLPEALTDLLTELGCDNEAALRSVSSRVENLEKYIKKVGGKKWNEVKRKKLLGDFSSDPEEFEFLPGHLCILEELQTKMQSLATMVPSQPRRHAQPPSNSNQVSGDQSGASVDLETKKLSRVLNNTLQNDFSLRHEDTTNPLYVLTLKNACEGTLLCQIDACRKRKHTVQLSRSSKRPWSTSNYYRHVKAVHMQEPSSGKRQMTLDQVARRAEEHVDDPAEITVHTENLAQEENGGTIWQKWRYSRTARAQRQLEVAALASTPLTDYWNIVNDMERVIKENETLHSTVRTLMDRLVEQREGTQRPEEISEFLHALNSSALRNAGRNRGGERYENNLALFMAHFFMLAGPKAYADLRLNRPQIIPSTSTVNGIMGKNKRQIVEGVFYWEDLCTFLDERGYPRVVIVEEDATRCVSGVQYHSVSNQLVGFVARLDADGLPVVASFPATSEAVIRHYFDTEKMAQNVYCIVVRPLVDTATSFCLCCFGTDNKFTANDVLNRWAYIQKEAATNNIRIAMRATDGDTRCLSAMKQLMFPPSANPLAWHFWFRSKLEYTAENPHEICVQDPIHVTTKLRNQLLRKITLCMGEYFVSVNHLRFLISQVSKDQHLLAEGDLDGTDRMNFRAAEKLFSERIISLLEVVPDSNGTAAYLEMGRYVMDAFLDHSLTPAERIRMVWTAVFFYRGWRHWVEQTSTCTMKENFLTTNCYTCIEINAHALILLTRYHRDNAGKENLGDFAPWLWGSQECEKLFRRLRSMTTTHHTAINFTVKEFSERLCRAALEEDIKTELRETFLFSDHRRAGKRREDRGHLADSTDFLACLDDQEILVIVKEATSDAQRRLDSLGMGSTVPSAFCSIPEVEPADSDEDGTDDERDAPEEIQEDPEDECELQSIGRSLFSGEVSLRTYSTSASPSSPFVEVLDNSGKTVVVKKSSLVWMLASRGKNSNDRTTRVKENSSGRSDNRAGVSYDGRASKVGHAECIAIGDWCVFRNTDKRGFLAGQVLKFSFLTGKGQQRQYKGMTVPTAGVVDEDHCHSGKGKRPRRDVGALCHMYEINNDSDNFGVLHRMKMNDVHPIRGNYIATISAPIYDEESNMCLNARSMAILPPV